MRSRFVVVLALIAGCGEKSATPPRGPSLGFDRAAARAADAPSEAVGAPKVERAALGRAGATAVQPPSAGVSVGLAAPPVGHLERRDHLGHLFEALARLDDGRADDDVRIVQYGDSHTASDLGTSAFRRALQVRFGDGGRGFVSIGKPWKTYVQDGVRGGMTDGFDPVRVKSRDGAFYGLDGCYGLLGVGIGAAKAGERAWTEVAAHATRLELDYWRDPGGGSFDVFVDGAPARRVATRAEQPQSGFCAFDLADAPHQIELRTVGDGDVRVFGMALDRAQVGVVVDALGINGAEVFTPLRWSEPHFAEQLRHRAPDLVVLAYGTNESLEAKLSDAEYERAAYRRRRAIAAARGAGGRVRVLRPARSDGWSGEHRCLGSGGDAARIARSRAPDAQRLCAARDVVRRRFAARLRRLAHRAGVAARHCAADLGCREPLTLRNRAPLRPKGARG
jgi:hypothetical protein